MLKIDKKCFGGEVTDDANTVERYGQFLRRVSCSGRFHLYYDGAGLVKFPFFFGCPGDMGAGMDETLAGRGSLGILGGPGLGRIGDGCSYNDVGDCEGGVERAACADAADAGETWWRWFGRLQRRQISDAAPTPLAMAITSRFRHFPAWAQWTGRGVQCVRGVIPMGDPARLRGGRRRRRGWAAG